MLTADPLVAFVPTTDYARAQAFYVGVLGLRVLESSPYALVLEAAGTVLRITEVSELTPQPFTVLGWRVGDAADVLRQLVAAGVAPERFDGMPQDELGAWTTPGGDKVGWFKDPDGNVLSVTEYATRATHEG